VCFLLDANILSEERKPHPAPKVQNWLLQNVAAAGISAVTVGEFTRGASVLAMGKPRLSLEAWIDEIVRDFTGRILPLGLEEMRTWGHLFGTLQKRGITLPRFDSLLAATALTHDLVLVTRNTADFAGTGVTVFNPFE
jgi:predicted nucleic acid-binding protein